MTCKRADGTEFTRDVHDEIRPVYQDEFDNRGPSRDFARRI